MCVCVSELLVVIDALSAFTSGAGQEESPTIPVG